MLINKRKYYAKTTQKRSQKLDGNNKGNKQTKFKIKLLAHLWKTFFFVQMKIHQKKKKKKNPTNKNSKFLFSALIISMATT